MEKKLPNLCPSCDQPLYVEVMHCKACHTKVSGEYKLPGIMLLPPEDQRFITAFIKTSGSIKLMAEQMSLSYPTVRNILDDIIDKINHLES
jgi:hypothetical protein